MKTRYSKTQKNALRLCQIAWEQGEVLFDITRTRSGHCVLRRNGETCATARGTGYEKVSACLAEALWHLPRGPNAEERPKYPSPPVGIFPWTSQEIGNRAGSGLSEMERFFERNSPWKLEQLYEAGSHTVFRLSWKERLPRKLSDLIDVFLEDIERAKKAGVRIDMNEWLVTDDGLCVACAAGSVALQRLNVTNPAPSYVLSSPHTWHEAGLISLYERSALISINHVRDLNIHAAMRSLPHVYLSDKNREALFAEVAILRTRDEPRASYHEDPEHWCSTMRELQTLLRKYGI